MSFSFRSRPKLSDRYRGKSGDEILHEIKNQLDEDRKMFFESTPGWNSTQTPGSFSRAGHPIDDMMSRGRQDIRSHLDDLAQRHPEFADHLRCPPWGGEMGASSKDSLGRKRCGSSGGEDSVDQASQQSEESPSRGRARHDIPLAGDQSQQQFGEDQEKGRGQRSWSAPPDNRSQTSSEPPRYVSRLDIPINSGVKNTSGDQGKPPVPPKHQLPHNGHQQNSAQSNLNSKSNQQGGNVRHIPIFVEGRDEPLLPKEVGSNPPPTEKIFTEKVPPQPTFSYERPCQFSSRQNQQHSHMHPETQFSRNAAHSKGSAPSQVPQHSPSPRAHQQRQDCEPQERSQQKIPSPKPDQISRVQAVQHDVDELKVKVEKYCGNSRKEKEYLYLDEMLTRCLVALDNIETEGREDVRQARKAVIRNIQQCISLLESKVPNSDEVNQIISDDLEKEMETPEQPPVQSGPENSGAASIQEQASSDNKQLIIEDNEELKMDVAPILNENLEGKTVVSDNSDLTMDIEPINHKGANEILEGKGDAGVETELVQPLAPELIVPGGREGGDVSKQTENASNNQKLDTGVNTSSTDLKQMEIENTPENNNDPASHDVANDREGKADQMCNVESTEKSKS